MTNFLVCFKLLVCTMTAEATGCDTPSSPFCVTMLTINLFSTWYHYSSGRLSQMNMEFSPMECTREKASFSWSVLTCTTMKLAEENMSLELSWWIWNQEPWTVYDQDLTDRSSDQIILYLDNLELETTGPRVTTQKELSWSTLFLM